MSLFLLWVLAVGLSGMLMFGLHVHRPRHPDMQWDPWAVAAIGGVSFMLLLALYGLHLQLGGALLWSPR